ncbi:unnamed protein product [Pleuronectes platessa]|uniref:Uncharacterized protein n=1 Tax=Pleuronectes platessa TaxID=8262 RepID=A0A9N7VA89_PLEPL|nr:unnamed protein product [Pleuronectes platessa]
MELLPPPPLPLLYINLSSLHVPNLTSSPETFCFIAADPGPAAAAATLWTSRWFCAQASTHRLVRCATHGPWLSDAVARFTRNKERQQGASEAAEDQEENQKLQRTRRRIRSFRGPGGESEAAEDQEEHQKLQRTRRRIRSCRAPGGASEAAEDQEENQKLQRTGRRIRICRGPGGESEAAEDQEERAVSPLLLLRVSGIEGVFVSASHDEPDRLRVASSQMPVHQDHQGARTGDGFETIAFLSQSRSRNVQCNIRIVSIECT